MNKNRVYSQSLYYLMYRWGSQLSTGKMESTSVHFTPMLLRKVCIPLRAMDKTSNKIGLSNVVSQNRWESNSTIRMVIYRYSYKYLKIKVWWGRYDHLRPDAIWDFN